MRAVHTRSNQLKLSEGVTGTTGAKNDSNNARGGGAEGGTPAACGNKPQIYSIMRRYSERAESKDKGGAEGSIGPWSTSGKRSSSSARGSVEVGGAVDAKELCGYAEGGCQEAGAEAAYAVAADE